jgi:archaellum component FlaC
MELKDWLGIVISSGISLLVMAFTAGGLRESLKTLRRDVIGVGKDVENVEKDIDNMAEKHRKEVNPFLQDMSSRLIRVETEISHMTNGLDRLEKKLEALFQKL